MTAYAIANVFFCSASLKSRTRHWNNCKKMTAPDSLTEPAKALKRVPGALRSLAGRQDVRTTVPCSKARE